jgi:periplasmic protein TonB
VPLFFLPPAEPPGILPTLPVQAQSGLPPPGMRPSIITNPDWLRRPNADEVADVFPEAALDRGVSGRATVACAVTAEGKLTGCSVVAEDPPGEGFGGAALALTVRFAMRPMTRDGAAVGGGTVRIPMRFIAPPPPAE